MIGGYSLDWDNPVTDAERDAILGEIAARPIGCALSLKMVPAWNVDGQYIILIVQRFLVGVETSPAPSRAPIDITGCFDHTMPKYALAKEYTSWHAVRRDLSNLLDVLMHVRVSSQSEGRG